MKQTALLVFAYSAKNAGDMAITIGAIDKLLSEYSNLICISRYAANDDEYIRSAKFLWQRYPQLKIEPSPFHLNRGEGRLSVLKSYIQGALKLMRGNLFESTLTNTDCVYFNGGNLLRCSSLSDFIRLIAVLSPLREAIRLEKKVIILPHSTAGTNWLGRKVLGHFLPNAHKIFVREPKSYEQFKQLYPACNFILTTDCAFAIKPTAHNAREKIVAITTRSQTMGDLHNFSAERKQKIKNQLVAGIKACREKGYDIHLVSQTKKDVAFTDEIYQAVHNIGGVKHITCFDVDELIKLYARCELLVGMRLHSIILALNSGTPVIGYFSKEWGLKNPGLLSQFQQTYGFIEDEFDLEGAIVENPFGDVRDVESDPKIKDALLDKFDVKVAAVNL